MAIKYYEAGTRFNPELYVITLGKVDEEDSSNNRIALGIEVKMGDDVVKLQTGTPLAFNSLVPVTDFGFQNYE